MKRIKNNDYFTFSPFPPHSLSHSYFHTHSYKQTQRHFNIATHWYDEDAGKKKNKTKNNSHKKKRNRKFYYDYVEACMKHLFACIGRHAYVSVSILYFVFYVGFLHIIKCFTGCHVKHLRKYIFFFVFFLLLFLWVVFYSCWFSNEHLTSSSVRMNEQRYEHKGCVRTRM